jgi:hypothetical protein
MAPPGGWTAVPAMASGPPGDCAMTGSNTTAGFTFSSALNPVIPTVPTE